MTMSCSKAEFAITSDRSSKQRSASLDRPRKRAVFGVLRFDAEGPDSGSSITLLIDILQYLRAEIRIETMNCHDFFIGSAGNSMKWVDEHPLVRGWHVRCDSLTSSTPPPEQT